MDKVSPASRNDLDKLKTRIQFLEKENQWYFSALELVASMGEMHREVPRFTNPNEVFDMAERYLKKMIPFKSLGFFLVKENDHNFFLAHGSPDEELGGLRVEMDYQIEKGTFAWALKQNRALVVDSELFREKLFLHVLGTKTRVKGMVMGRLKNNIRQIPSEVSALVSIILHNTANALENGHLYRLLTDQNKNLEKTVEKRTQELESITVELKKNIQELKDFAFIASHDLQEPLRKVISFGERLKTKYDNMLDPKAKEYIKVMSKATGHMQHMINGLLQLSRITTQSRDLATLPMEDVVNEALSDLEGRIVRSRSQIMVGELPSLRVDRIQIRQLFTQLIANAIKFKRENVQPEISISSHPLGNGRWEIWVSDNGVGFQPKYAERIFKPFERLYGRSEGEGTGMGLAICRKVVERHGGTLTAQSKPNLGATFIITLSEQGPDPE